jgi:hypothetical protein
MAASLVLIAPLSAQTLRGRVQELGSQQPIAVVDLAVLNEAGKELARTQSDSLGIFSMSWGPPGPVRLRAQRLGFQSSTSSEILVRRGEAVTVRMLMSTTPVSVQPLVVDTRATEIDIMGDFADVERRRKLGLGKFITHEQIRQRGNSRISEALEHVPGIFLRPEPGNSHSVLAYANMNTTGMVGGTSARRRNQNMERSPANGECPMMLFLDGRIHRYPIAGVNILPAQQVEIIEVYRTMSEVPAMFAGEHVRCGVIAIWTRKQ